ncbi:hypothetical protein FC83_GL002975 [Agrilactobacillus composti DSM 18527 = JCM 14202]|uniref:Uncharacterized protein n=2 Tax=Agrilactobacillus TaxID=2767875 RepID=A0A0R1XUG0_9LACO|nr:hypothetical protein FC83_GL002975 [Agrilactobacillus composti DSM 18527 = JCM 14202]
MYHLLGGKINMHFRKWLLGIFVILGTVLLSQGQVKAMTIQGNESTPPLTVDSYNMPVPIYSNPECTQSTGKTLNTGISQWLVIQSASYSSHGVDAYNLGNSQWVKGTDVFYGHIGQTTPMNRMGILEAYSAGKKVPVYDSPQLWHITGYLDPSIRDWAVTKYATFSPDPNYISRLDLGNNQWVDSSKDVQAIRNPFIFKPNEPLYNSNGVQTGSLSDAASYYKVFGAKTINGETYVNLGDDNQWAKFKDGIVN